MKDFRLRNDTKLLFRSDPSDDLVKLTAGKRVLFVYCGGSVKRNGCYADIRNAVRQGGRMLYEAGHSSRERARSKPVSAWRWNIRSSWSSVREEQA